MFLRPKRPSTGLDMAPLIDVVFLLLIFFMLSSSFLNPVLPLTLPQAEEGEVDPAQIIVVSVDENDTLYLNHQPVDQDEFMGLLQERMELFDTRMLYFQGDADMPYNRFVELMDLARGAGAEQFNIVHQSRD